MKSLTYLFLALIVLFGTASDVFACACCAEKGTWYRGSVRQTDAEATLFTKWAEHAAKGTLMTGNADIAEFGLFDPLPSSAELLFAKSASAPMRVVVDLTDSSGRSTGSVMLNRSLRLRPSKLMTDIGDGREAQGGGSLLYKEVVFTGISRGTGSLAKGIRPGTPFSLVLKGRGNGCHNDSDYSSWSLRIGTATFFGDLSMK